MDEKPKSKRGKPIFGGVIVAIFLGVAVFLFTVGMIGSYALPIAFIAAAVGGGGLTMTAEMGSGTLSVTLEAILSAIGEFFAAIFSGIGDIFGGLG
jgi:hypothetical protein